RDVADAPVLAIGAHARVHDVEAARGHVRNDPRARASQSIQTIAVAGMRPCAKPFVGMGLLHDHARRYLLAAFSSRISRVEHRVGTAFGRGPGAVVYERAYTFGCAGAIDVEEEMELPEPIETPTHLPRTEGEKMLKKREAKASQSGS